MYLFFIEMNENNIDKTKERKNIANCEKYCNSTIFQSYILYVFQRPYCSKTLFLPKYRK